MHVTVTYDSSQTTKIYIYIKKNIICLGQIEPFAVRGDKEVQKYIQCIHGVEEPGLLQV